MTTTEAPPTHDVAEPPPRRRWHPVRWVVAGLAVVALAVPTAWALVGLHPHLTSGYTGGVDAAAVSEVGDVTGHPTGNVWWVDAGDGTYWSAVRNDGRAPVTLRGAGLDIAIRQKVTFATITQPYVGFGTPAESITLGPGDEAQVIVRLEVCGEGTFSGGPGMSTSVEGVDVDATTWGWTRKVHLEMSGAYGFYAKTVSALPASPDCPVGP